MQDFIKINERDNVIVALNPIPAGTELSVPAEGGTVKVTAREEIPAGHKMAIKEIPAGGEVIKYGFRIGNTKEDIPCGAWIHTHNVKTALGDLLTYSYEPVDTRRRSSRSAPLWDLSGRTAESASATRYGSFPRWAV